MIDGRLIISQPSEHVFKERAASGFHCSSKL
jgi:hypothetical protein